MPASIADKLEVAVKTRERYFQRVQNCYDLIKNPQGQADFIARCALMSDTFNKFELVNDQINALNTQREEGETAIDTLKVTKSFEELYFRVLAHEAAIKETQANLATASNQSTVQLTKCKLPMLNVPMYGGDIAAFPSWKSLYDELVHSSPQLSDIQKFSYLKSYLKGSALLCVETISFTAANYPLAYKSLVDRYSKKRTLASSLLNKLLDFKPLNTDSVQGLRTFLDGFHTVVESVKSLCIVNLEEFILLHLALKVLDSNTSLEFEKEMADKEFPTFHDLVEFVKRKANILEQTAESCAHSSASSKPKNQQQRVESRHKVLVSTQVINSPQETQSKSTSKQFNKSVKCHVCADGPHVLSKCPKFLKLESSKRFSVVKEMKLCFACFSATHSVAQCGSLYRCRTCGSSKHHSLLHPAGNQTKSSNHTQVEQQQTVEPTSAASTSQGTTVVTAVSNVSHPSEDLQQSSCSTILLGTAVIQVEDVYGNWISTRCVVDPGSQVTIISERLAQALNLPRKHCGLQISGIGSGTCIKTKGKVVCKLLPNDQNLINKNQSPLCINAVIMPKITSTLPNQISVEVLKRFHHLKLADTTYYSNTNSSSSHIDLLLGAEHYQDILIPDSLPILKGKPSAVPSIFGWLLLGRVADQANTNNCDPTSFFISTVEEDSVSTQLQKFWALEEVGSTAPIINKEDQECEDHFMKTHTRDETGKYIVRLPFHSDSTTLGSNREKATKLFFSMEKRLDKNPPMKALYCENIQTYLDMDHMELAKQPADYLLCHHGVYRENSSTTKLRVVFNPNLASDSGQTLSKVLKVGPKLQLDIQDLMVNFRLKPIAITCDIQAMYRCIIVAPEDRHCQHILWRSENNQDVQEYELKTVTFGLPPSPFLAQRVIKQLACDENEKYPEACQVLLDSIYVDDIVTGADSVQSAKQLRDQLMSLLGAGGFSLRKWASSHREVLDDLSSDLCETPHLLGSTESIAVLGLQWCPTRDSFVYSVSINQQSKVTKRSVLSVIASIYDVNGFLSPVIVFMKIFLQQLWLNREDTWDTPLPAHLHDKWCKLIAEMHVLSNIQIPRYILRSGYTSLQLVGFADASHDAYAAVVYLRVVHTHGVQINLLRAKTKVAPLKVQTINRLELCAALLLARVMISLSFLVKKVNIQSTYLFSDSKIVLSWLKTQPHLLKTYVANRVVQILEWTDPSHWHHVSSENNCADPGSRGLTPTQLLNNTLWFNGPPFLLLEPDQWPLSKVMDPCKSSPELKSSEPISLAVQSNFSLDLINVIQKYSSLSKLQKVMAFVLRFINNLRFPDRQVKSKTLSVQELRNSLLACLRISQSVHLTEDINAAKKGSACSSALRSLSPILNSEGLLVVGGRLANAPLPEHAKHPILLSKQCHLTILIIRMYHHITLHGGPKLIQSLIHQRYWILNARNMIRKVIFQCVPCAKMRCQTIQPIMADLPSSRFSQGRPFLNVGVDFAGPFSFKTGPRRNSPVGKCYMAVFVCMATKCIHLELVSSLCTPAFLATLDRFVGRRGLPQCIYSDNGTNFRGAASYLNEVQQFLSESNDDITNHLVTQEVKWFFIPPSAPNFGGLWEAGVKSAKLHLKHVLHEHALNFEEFNTLLVRIEAILNSRPLCSLSSDPNDGLDYLSPGHFLIGAPLLASPDKEDCVNINISAYHRWQLITQATHCFWKKWRQDYINTQLQRTKWSTPDKQIQVGDVVLIQTQSTPPQSWPLGRVISLLPGKDNIVRVVTLKTQHGNLIRPVSKLVPLPVSQ